MKNRKMQSAKQKLRNMASTAKKKLTICQAKAYEKAEKEMARTKEEKEIAHERRKVKEAEAKMDMHMAKEVHAEDKLMAKQSHYHVSHGPHLPYHEPMQAPAQVMGHGYGHNRHGVTSVPPVAAYPPGINSVPPPAAYLPGTTSVPPSVYPPTGHHHHHHPY